MKKVIVIGSPGAGKSCFARRLRDKTGLPLYYLDQIWHLPNKTHVSREEFDARLAQLLRRDAWIIDGEYSRTLEPRLRACDTVFLLDYPLELCLAGAASRVGVKREDLPWVEDEFDEEFRQWIIDFHQRKLPMVYALLEQYKAEREVHVFRTREEAERFLGTLPDPA